MQKKENLEQLGGSLSHNERGVKFCLQYELRDLMRVHPAVSLIVSTSQGLNLLSHHTLLFASSIDQTTGGRSQTPPMDQTERTPAVQHAAGTWEVENKPGPVNIWIKIYSSLLSLLSGLSGVPRQKEAV